MFMKRFLQPIALAVMALLSGQTCVDSKESSIKIDLPEKTLSFYLLPVGGSPGDLKQLTEESVKQRVESPLKEMILDKFLPSPLVQIKLVDRDELPPVPFEIISSTGASAEQEETVRKARQFVTVWVEGLPLEFPPYYEIVCRSIAGALAAELKTFAVDAFSLTAMTAENALEIPRPFKASGLIMVLVSSNERGCWMTTKGLQRFGLPELQVVDAPPQVENEIARVMTGLAWRLLKDCGSVEASSVDIPQDIELSSRDIADAYGEEKLEGGSAVVHLRLDTGDKDRETFLTITAPPGDKRASGEYLIDLCRPIFSYSHDATVQARASRAMDKAMDTARAGLPAIRQRFLSGKLPPRGQLIVKFGVKVNRGTEYLWAFVTDWGEENVIKGSCGNDAQDGSNLRAGQPVTLELDSIVDWAVMVDNEIVEGAWTNKVLGH
ncbi:MAG: DUF2314 domain-containing protein [Candidatus Obscuribacterales bacterium]